MPWNGSGTFARNYSWVTDDANGINITASRMDADTNDIVNNGLGNCLTRDGQGIATAVLPMGGFRHTGVGNGLARTDYSAYGQVQDSAAENGGTSTGAGGVFAVTLTPAITAYALGQRFSFITHQAAAGGDTLNVNGVGAKPLVKGNGTAVGLADFANAQELLVLYDTGGGGRFILLNTALASVQISGSGSGVITISGQAAAGTWSLVLPNTAGLAGQPLISGAGGATSWGTITGTGAFVLQTSPAFSGTPTTPTQAQSDNSTQIVNSSWVTQKIGAVVNLALITAAPGLTYNSPGF